MEKIEAKKDIDDHIPEWLIVVPLYRCAKHGIFPILNEAVREVTRQVSVL